MGRLNPVSRGQILRRVRGQGDIHFPCSADHEQDWQPYPADPYSACDDHSYRHTYCTRHARPNFQAQTGSKNIDQSGKVANPARGQLNREN